MISTQVNIGHVRLAQIKYKLIMKTISTQVNIGHVQYIYMI